MKNKGKFFGAILILLAILFGFDEDTIEKLKELNKEIEPRMMHN